MALTIGNEFTSFTAAALVHQGNQICLTGNALPLVPGVTFTGVDSVNVTGWPTILRNNTEVTVEGNVLTLYGFGANQILMSWDNTSTSSNGKHSSMYIRSKSSTSSAAWSAWYEVLDSGNFVKYIATLDGEGAVGTWGISITGNAHTAEYLLPIPTTGTYDRSSYTVPTGSRIVWSEAFGDTSLKYTANGGQQAYTNTGDLVLFVSPNPSADQMPLNMYINGTYYGHFEGDVTGTADAAKRAYISTVPNTLTYFDNAIGHFNYTAYISYLKNISVASETGINGLPGYSNGLSINSEHTYYNQNDNISGSNGILQYGDAGPQVRFTVEPEGVRGVILFNTHAETAGLWPSFHFLGQTVSDTVTAPQNVVIKSAGVVAHQYLTVGSQQLNNTYALTVNGQSGFYNNINMIDSIIHFAKNKQQIEWYDSAADRSETNDVGLQWNGIGTYTVNTYTMLNISNTDGINITTNNYVNLFHNGYIIPSAATASVGSATKSIYMDSGVLKACTYSLSATVSSGAANRIAYYSGVHVIDDAAHFVNNSKIAINSTIEPTETLLVNGTARVINHLYLGDTGNKSIYYKGTVIETAAISFIDNNISGATGNGMFVGAGALTVVGAGSSSAATANVLSITGISANSKQLFLLSDSHINIEANAETFSGRIGIQITASGHVIPIKTEAVNTNAQYLGSSESRWAKVYIGTADSYGSSSQPIYWNAGVPAALTFIANRIQFSSTTTSISGGTTLEGHYASNTKIAINSVAEPNDTLFVNGNAKIAGNLNPNTTETYSLGTGGETPLRWNSLFIGPADTYGSGTQPIYWDNGVPTATTYALSATVNGGTASRIAYYSGAHAIKAGTIRTDGKYLANITYLTVNANNQSTYRLYVNGPSYLGGNVIFADSGTTGSGSQLIWTGSSDGAKIYYQVNTADTGGLILEVSDDGDEFIQFAHTLGSASIYMRPNSAQIYPHTTNAGSLGVGGNSPVRWGHVYVGTADTYGDAYTPVYWNNGVPAVVAPVQYSEWQIDSGHTTATLTATDIFTVDSYVLTIVVTSGEANLNAPISWTTSTNTLVLSTSAATSGIVSGYVLTARGVATGATNVSSI